MNEFEEFSRNLNPETTQSVRSASAARVRARQTTLSVVFEDVEGARAAAAHIKQNALDQMEILAPQFIAAAEKRGIIVHRATTAEDANAIVIDIAKKALEGRPGDPIVKAKSMATEETELNHALEGVGLRVVETDLGEYVLQIDHDKPSHIVAPIVHKTRKDVAKSFAREGLGPYTESPEELAMQARTYLRKAFESSAMGISGVNFAMADSGRLVLIENEGNNRLATTAPRVHVAVMGLEKLLEHERDLALFLPILAGSATGQKLTTYIHFIGGPRPGDEKDGPEEVHLVILDNGRENALKGPYKEILRCIRCGACQNVCPVYRQASGHAYDNVYSGPIGAVLAPALQGVEKWGRLAFASSLCGACEEVCPVKIPFSHLLLQVRKDYKSLVRDVNRPVWSGFAFGASRPGLWKSGLRMLPMVEGLAPIAGMGKGWAEFRSLPSREGRVFRQWWKSNGSAEVALTPVEQTAPQLESKPVESAAMRFEGDLWAGFCKEFEALGGRIASREDLAELKGQSAVFDEDVPDWAKEGVSVAADIWGADYGMTMADGAVAASGSILVDSKPGRRRLNSLAPPLHVVLLDKSSLVSTLDKIFPIGGERSSVIITGPSRTADIEGILVKGVHGPKQIWIVPI